MVSDGCLIIGRRRMYGSYLVPAPIWFPGAYLVPSILAATIWFPRLFGSVLVERAPSFEVAFLPFSSDSRPVLYLYLQATALNCARNSCNLTNLHREPNRSSTAPSWFLAIFADRSLSWRFSLPFRGQYGRQLSPS